MTVFARSGTSALIGSSNRGGVLVSVSNKPTKVIPFESMKRNPWAPYGNNDNFPKELKEDLQSVGVLARGIQTRRNLHYGKGMVPYRVAIDDDGNFNKKIFYNEEIRSFLRRNRMNVKQPKIIGQLEKASICFCEVVLSIDRSKIVGVKPFDFSHCRMSWIDEKYGRSMFVYVSGNFTKGFHKGKIESVPMLDMDDPLGHLKNGKSNKYMIVVKYDDDELYYPKPIWNALREGGWMNIIQSIPKIKEAVFKHQMILKYHIQVSEPFMQTRFPKWKDGDSATKDKIFEDYLTDIDSRLKGTDNSGKTIMSIFDIEKSFGKEVAGLKIDSIKHELNDGMYLLDTADVNSQTLFTIGLNPAIIGHGIPGGKEMGGSGSNIRESLLAHRAQIEPERVVSTEPMRIISDFNGWGDDLDWGYIDMDTSQTLDQNPTGSRTTL